MSASTDIATITLTVDGRSVPARPGSTVLEVCREAGIEIPTLCHDPRLEPFGACRLCVVEIEGMRGFPTSCTTLATDGMVVTTVSGALHEIRSTVVELLLSDHKVECLTCESNGGCALQDAAYDLGIETVRFEGEKHESHVDDANPLIERDLAKCISCGRCVRICHEVQGCDVWGYTGRGFDSVPNTPFGVSLLDAGCEFCGQCVSTCPTGALTDKLSRFGGRHWELEWTQTTCGYCGVGCTIEFAIAARRHRRRARAARQGPQLRQPLREGPLRLELRAASRPAHRAAHQARRRVRRIDVGRGLGPCRREARRDPGLPTAATR